MNIEDIVYIANEMRKDVLFYKFIPNNCATVSIFTALSIELQVKTHLHCAAQKQQSSGKEFGTQSYGDILKQFVSMTFHCRVFQSLQEIISFRLFNTVHRYVWQNKRKSGIINQKNTCLKTTLVDWTLRWLSYILLDASLFNILIGTVIALLGPPLIRSSCIQFFMLGQSSILCLFMQLRDIVKVNHLCDSTIGVDKVGRPNLMVICGFRG
ncbi:Hypothetical_protein [Hexamita inflata]|uniref:Hypothetical_protein n=1 Tax=Hexamita inflata TaxID=28002 RepID=A0AA86Q5W3_9EUKA|nr:Hypothetical protein HINF_LOCUS37553 [Hexamita inflata]CAI9949912.1 Hypothetical protein HINF_LOCUS37557 [Hexamita inflata]